MTSEKKETYTLLLYWSIPSGIYYYLIPNSVLEGERAFGAQCLVYLREAQYKFVNDDDMNEGMQFLMNACSPELEYCDKDAPKAWECAFKPFKVLDKESVIEAAITRVFTSGFIE